MSHLQQTGPHPHKGNSGRQRAAPAATLEGGEAKAARRHLAAYAVARVLAESETVGDAAPKVLQAIAETLGWEMGALWTVDAEAGVLVCEAVWHDPAAAVQEFESLSREIAFPAGVGLPGRVWTSGKPGWIANVVEDANFPRAPIAAKEGLHGAFAFPVMLGRELLGVMEFFSSEIRQPDQELLDMTEATGSQIGQFIERKRAEEELRHSRERFAKAFHASPAAMTIVRAKDRCFLDVNRSFLSMLGYSRDEVVGRTPMELGIWAEPEDRESLRMALDAEGSARDLELPLRTKSGERLHVLGSAEIIYIGGERCVLTLFYDITERKRSEEGQRFLAEASALLAASLDYSMTLASVARLAVPHLGDWCAIVLLENEAIRQVAVVHSDPAKIALSRQLEERYALDPGAAYGVTNVLRSGQSDFYPELTDSMLAAAARDEEHLNSIRELGLKSAMIVPLLARGRTLGAITFVSAESGRRYTEADLAVAEELGRRAGLAIDNARLYAELQRVNESKDEFLGLVSHELRTPITAIYGGARMLRSRFERLDEESKAGLIADLEQESERLYRMVENLLALARVELGAKLETEPVLAQRLIEKVAAGFRQRRPGRPLEMRVDAGLDPVAASPAYLEQVLHNLLSNADKYSPADSPIEIVAQRTEGEVLISVLDRGPGVGPEEWELIFERFYRSERTSKRAKGVGLGLTVCKRLVEAQSGSIEARAREGGGLEVGVTLPPYAEEEGSE